MSLRRSGAAPEPQQRRSSRLWRLAGETRRARLLTAGTALALLVAIAAFIALRPSEDKSIPRDAYTLAAEKVCLGAKSQIVAAEQAAVRAAAHRDQSSVARALVPIVATWRAEMGTLKTPDDRLELAEDLDRALREVEIQVSKLALVASSGDRGRILRQARRVDEETTGVEAAITALGLEECANQTIGFARPSG
jgi:hypothetical protein